MNKCDRCEPPLADDIWRFCSRCLKLRHRSKRKEREEYANRELQTSCKDKVRKTIEDQDFGSYRTIALRALEDG